MTPSTRRELEAMTPEEFAEAAIAVGQTRGCVKVFRDIERKKAKALLLSKDRSGWQEIDARYHGGGGERTYYGVAIGEDYSFCPDAIFSSEEAANEWVAWQRGLWTDEEENGISPGSEDYVLPVRRLEGVVWNCWHPVSEAP